MERNYAGSTQGANDGSKCFREQKVEEATPGERLDRISLSALVCGLAVWEMGSSPQLWQVESLSLHWSHTNKHKLGVLLGDSQLVVIQKTSSQAREHWG